MKIPSKIQKQAIMHLHGPAEVIAGPGSGKTFTIIHRVFYLINQCHISPDRILVITYTKAAAMEMQERYEKELREQSISMNGHVHFGTFHSICYHILQQSGMIQPSSLIKEADRRRLVQSLLDRHGMASPNDYDRISHLLNEISRKKNAVEETNGCMEIAKEDFQKIYREYNIYLREQNRIDFDDMITECLKLLRNNAVVCQKYQEQFSYILADEFQDINLIQYQVLKLLSLPENNLFVVGDDDQAIYGFRGATPGIMKQFMMDFPSGKQIMLTENYRSGSKIVLLAKEVIQGNQERFEKEFLPVQNGGWIQSVCFANRQEEERQLICDIKALQEEVRNRTAIILRTNLEAVQYKELLQQAHIPVKGQKHSQSLLNSFILYDFISFLSYIYLGHRRSDFIRFMNKPDRFLLRETFPYETVTREQIAYDYHEDSRNKQKLEQFFSMLTIAESLNPKLAISLFRRNLGYDQYLIGKAAGTGKKSTYLRQADELQALLAGYVRGTDPDEFIRSRADKLKEKESSPIREDGVAVITMHASKGLEFDSVYLPDVNEGIIPGKKCMTKEAIAEERRLLYVAITRARNALTLYYTKERGRKLSRFLEGIIS